MILHGILIVLSWPGQYLVHKLSTFLDTGKGNLDWKQNFLRQICSPNTELNSKVSKLFHPTFMGKSVNNLTNNHIDQLLENPRCHVIDNTLTCLCMGPQKSGAPCSLLSGIWQRKRSGGEMTVDQLLWPRKRTTCYVVAEFSTCGQSGNMTGWDSPDTRRHHKCRHGTAAKVGEVSQW